VPGVAAIYVNYNADCTFTMSVDGGITAAPNATVPPGVYQLLVWLPNPNQGYSCGTPTFTFNGPGVSSTTVFRGQELHDEHVIPALQAGATYVAADASSPDGTRHLLTVSSSGSSSSLVGGSTTTTTSTGSSQCDLVGCDIAPYRGKLLAGVSATGKATLTGGGKPVGALKAGRYDIRVSDSDRQAGFFVQRAGRKPVIVAGIRFTGTRTLRVALTAGKWVFFAKAGRATGFTVQ
jgi:hypothetical protein